MSGFCDKVLRINLTTKEITTESPGEAFFLKYLGGKNILGYYLNKEMDGSEDALSPENKVVIATSVLTGTPIAGSSRYTVGAKSPLTDGFLDSESGGFFGPELKFAGYDAVIIEGKADKPCYIYINNDNVEILDGNEIWGKETKIVQDFIREKHDDKRIKVLQTGPGGEKLVRVASLTNNLKHWNGRGGLGAVFGSKNLRAVAVRGTNKVEIKDKAAIMARVKKFSNDFKNFEGFQTFAKYGTGGDADVLSNMGILPTRNFQDGEFEDVDKITGVYMNDTYSVGREGCYACPVRCKRVIKIEDDEFSVDPEYGGPEYETIGSLGSNCGIADTRAVCKANEICGKYGLDVIGTGMTVAFAMECYEKGVITKEDTGGLELNFGNVDAYLKIVQQIADREGFGDILAEGSYRAAKKIGNGAEKYAITVKKMEFAAHDPRGKWNIGLGYAVSPNGADHVVVEHDHAFMGDPIIDDDFVGGNATYCMYKLGLRTPTEPCSLDNDKLRQFVLLQKIWSLYDILDVCIFVGEPGKTTFTVQDMLDSVNEVTGFKITMYEFMQIAERGYIMGRLFNAKAGLTSKDDVLPERCFEGIGNGTLEGMAIDRDDFEHAKKTYYEMIGMNTDGTPLHGKLLELQIEDLES